MWDLEDLVTLFCCSLCSSRNGVSVAVRFASSNESQLLTQGGIGVRRLSRVRSKRTFSILNDQGNEPNEWPLRVAHMMRLIPSLTVLQGQLGMIQVSPLFHYLCVNEVVVSR